MTNVKVKMNEAALARWRVAFPQKDSRCNNPPYPDDWIFVGIAEGVIVILARVVPVEEPRAKGLADKACHVTGWHLTNEGLDY